MKKLTEYLNESILNEVSKEPTFRPETRKELKVLVERLIKERGNNADLNDIDTSLITDMSGIFAYSEFNGDISKWDVSNVKNMISMFSNSEFNGDISKWDVSKVKYMSCMFEYSKFNGNISKWNVRNVKDMYSMFFYSKFNGYIESWDISDYLIRNPKDRDDMFKGCPLEGNEPAWYKE